MFKKIVEFINSFKVKPVEAPAAPYKLEPPEVPVAEKSLPEAETIKFPLSNEMSVSEVKDLVEPEVKPAKKPRSRPQIKSVKEESVTPSAKITTSGKKKVEEPTKTIMKVVKARSPRKPASEK